MENRNADEEESDFYPRPGADAQYITILAKHFPHRLKKLTADDLMHLVQPVADSNFNTLSAAWCILALQAWSKVADISQFENLSIGEV